jgi:hypothetical protein
MLAEDAQERHEAEDLIHDISGSNGPREASAPRDNLKFVGLRFFWDRGFLLRTSDPTCASQTSRSRSAK